MLALYHTISFRYLRQRWSRALLVVASIALGTGTLVATRALNQAMAQATRGAVTPLPGFGELLITNSDSGVPRAALDDLAAAAIPGVQQLQPLVIGRAILPELNNRPAVLLGVQVPADATSAGAWGIETRVTNPLALISGKKPAFVGTELGRQIPPGRKLLRVRAGGQETQVAVAGSVDAHGPAAALGGSVVFLRLADAAAVMGRPDYVTRIDVVLAPDVDREIVRTRLEGVLAGRARVTSPEANDRMVRDVVGGVELGFALGGVGALIVGLFLVYNALSVSVAERRHDIGILRSVGATRLQVALLFAGEAGLLGLLGAVLGLPMGMALAQVSIGPLHQALNDVLLPLGGAPQVALNTVNALTAIAAGAGTALLAALVPALQAARAEPADAVRRVPLLASWRQRLLQIGGSLLLVAAGVGAFVVRASLPQRVGAFASAGLVLIGCLAAMPLLTALGARLLRPLARNCFGIEGRLAADNLSRSPGRTGLVIAALAAGTALMIETAGLTRSSEQAVMDWINESFVADLTVTSGSPIAAGGDSVEMSERLGAQLATVPGVESAVGARFRRPVFRNTMVFLVTVDAVAYHAAVRKRANVPGIDYFPELANPGTVLMSDNFAARHGVKVGDRITLPGARGLVELRVIGSIVDYSWSQGTLLMDRLQYREVFDDPLIDAFDIFVSPGASSATVRETILRSWGAEEGLVMLTKDEVRQTIVDMIRRLYSITHAQQVVVMLVAGLGVLMALLISVLQRRRELGLLRAVGASRLQVVRSLLAEAALMGLLGAGIGVLLGLPLEWYAVRVILFEESGFLFPVLVPWQTSATVIALAVAGSVAAGLVPALIAMRLNIAEAIAYE